MNNFDYGKLREQGICEQAIVCYKNLRHINDNLEIAIREYQNTCIELYHNKKQREAFMETAIKTVKIYDNEKYIFVSENDPNFASYAELSKQYYDLVVKKLELYKKVQEYADLNHNVWEELYRLEEKGYKIE